MNNLNQIPPEPNLHTTLKQPRPRFHAVISADLELYAPTNDRRPVPGPSVADVDGGRLVDITVEGDGKYLALMAGNIISVKIDITAKGQSNNAKYGKGIVLLAITASNRDGFEAEEGDFACDHGQHQAYGRRYEERHIRVA